jgi:hypothetical protein
MNNIENGKLDKRTKRMVFLLFLIAAGFYAGFIVLTAINS